jgi:D-alanyl-D-alanine carboxypeptidase
MRGKRAGFAAGLGVVVLAALAPVTARAQSPAPTTVNATSYVVVDVDSGVLLASREPDRQLAVASLQKLLTAIVVMERAKLTDVVVISRAASRANADHIIWPEGKTFTVEELLYGLILESSNGAAVALAEHVAGSATAFAGLMNAKAASLGAKRSHFMNPSGLDAAGQFSTTRDMAIIAQTFMRDETLARIARTFTHEIPWPNGSVTTLHTINRFLVRYPGAIGLKTGYTSAAGNSLAAAARRNGRTVLVVLARSATGTDDGTLLMNAAFAKLGPGRGGDDTFSANAPPFVTQSFEAEPALDAESFATEASAPAVVDAPAAVPLAVSRRPSLPGLAIVFATTGLVMRKRVRERRRVR